ncbi:hypothetical protein PTI98_000230 [Pleurotus ostreatus]|nr:hypothetical protein PTI98_000230 [Pleurotus ostreatus]
MSGVSNTLGAVQAATAVSGFLLGCLIVQGYGYFKRYAHDPWGIKCLVLLLLTLGAAQQLSMVAADYNMSIDNFGERDILARLPTSFGVAFFLDLFNSPLVESFYFWRIYKLTDKLWPCAIGTVLSWLRCAGWTVFAAQGAKEGYSNFSLLDSHTWLLAITVGYGLVANICVASIMVVFLYQNRNTTFMRTKVIIDRLILYTVQTCLITGLGYGTTLVTFLTMKHTFIWLGILACTSRVCTNCLLAELNDRPMRPRLGCEMYRSDATPDTDTPLEEITSSPIVINISTERALYVGSDRHGTSVSPSREGKMNVT